MLLITNSFRCRHVSILLFIPVIMETTDLGSVLGIASGVSASVLMICIAIGLTARFRHQQSHQNHPTRQHPHGSNNIREDKTAVKSTSHHHQNDPDMNPDILINGHSGNCWEIYCPSIQSIRNSISITLCPNSAGTATGASTRIINTMESPE